MPPTQLSIPAVYMRGGTSKGVFFHARDLPRRTSERDALLLRVIGSPDPYGKHTDGMGGATSSTSKIVIISPSLRQDCDVDFLFGAVSIDEPLIDYSGNCGNLSAAVGPFAITQGLVTAQEGLTCVRIWQVNLGKRIDAYVPVRGGAVVEDGQFMEDGVPFASAEVRLEFLDPGGGGDDTDGGLLALLPTGNAQDRIELPGAGSIAATLITAGNPTVFVRADALGLTGKELPDSVNRDRKLLDRLEAIRARASVMMGLAQTVQEATARRPATPKISWVARAGAYRTSAGVEVNGDQVDVLARIMSMGKLHHAYTGTGSIALGVAAALPGSLVNEIARTLPGVATRIGHVSGVLSVGADVAQRDGRWVVEKAVLSRSARRLMTGQVHVPPAGPLPPT